MAVTDPKIHYTRLPGRVWVPVSAQRAGSLWLTSDHILALKENGYAETYKRFYLTDIQGFIVHRTKRRMTLNLFFGTLLLLFFSITYLFSDAGVAFGITLWGGSLFWIGMIINSVSGPTCEVRIRTAVQTEILSPLQRISSFEKFYAQVRPLIVASQGELDPAQAGELAAQAGELAAFMTPTATAPTPPPIKIFSPRFHLWFFGMLAGTCLPGFMLFIMASPMIALAYFVFVTTGLILALAAIVRQHSEDCRDSALITITWIGGCLSLLSAVVHYFETIVYQFTPEALSRGSLTWGILYVDPSENDFLFWHISVFLFLAWGVGMFGFIRAWQLRPISADSAQS